MLTFSTSRLISLLFISLKLLFLSFIVRLFRMTWLRRSNLLGRAVLQRNVGTGKSQNKIKHLNGKNPWMNLKIFDCCSGTNLKFATQKAMASWFGDVLIKRLDLNVTIQNKAFCEMGRMTSTALRPKKLIERQRSN